MLKKETISWKNYSPGQPPSFLAMVITATVLLVTGYCAPEKEDKSMAIMALALAQPTQALPEPALETAKLMIDGGTILDASVTNCAENLLSLRATGTAFVTFHGLDFDSSASFLINARNTTTPAMDLDEDDGNGGAWFAQEDCPVDVKSNSPSIIEYQMMDCPLIPQGGSTSGTNKLLSIRLKCSKS